MSALKGYSYHQDRLLKDLTARLDNADNELDNKVETVSQYNRDMLTLTNNNTSHSNSIKNLKETKAEVIEFNSRVQQLDGNDATHAALMNSLESDYNQKASKAGFEEKMKELNANDATHDVRLDALERQFDGIESRVLGEVNDKVNELVLNTDFNALVAELQAKDTELGNKIITLAAKTDIDNALQNYQTLVAGLQTKTDYNAKMDKVVERHQDFEDRFTAIDQFFRAIAETYKLRRKNDLTEIVYNTEYQSDITIKDSIFTVHRKNRSALGIRVTPFIYNSMTGKIQVRNSSGVVVGEINKSDISSVTYNGEITFSSILSDSAFDIQICIVNSVGDMTDKITVSKTSFDGLPNHVAPADVTGLNAEAGDGSATITFNPVDGATGYKYYVVGGDTGDNPVWVSINSLSAEITGLTNGISYMIVVKAVNNYGESVTAASTSVIPKSAVIAKAYSLLGNAFDDITSGSVNAIAKDSDSNIYVGGSFTVVTNPDGTTLNVNNIAKWNTSNNYWSTLGSGVNGIVNTIAIDSNNNVYVGGNFLITGVTGTSYIAKWTPSEPEGVWSGLGSGTDDIVNTIATDSNNNVYVGGRFISAGGVTGTSYIAKWTPSDSGGSWSALGSGVNNIVNTIAIDSTDNIYIGGNFVNILNIYGNSYISKWTPYESGWFWGPLGSGVNNIVNTITIDSNNNIYAGGSFTSAGGITGTSYIAKWTPSDLGGSWSALSNGINNVNNIVNTIATDSNNNVYVGGRFISAGGVTGTSYIAKWTPSDSGGSWSALGSGVNNIVNTIAIDSTDNIYIGGNFVNMGGILGANRISKWTPSDSGGSWSALGFGVKSKGIIYAIDIDLNDNIYIGGSFTGVENISANNIAKWTPSDSGGSWSSIGGNSVNGVNDTIYAIAIDSNNNVYIGGQFLNVDGITGINRIAKWTPSDNTNGAWSALGSSVNGIVWSLIVDSDNNLYAGGSFSSAGGVSGTSRIAKWTPSGGTSGGVWSALGSGVNNGSIYTIAIKSGNVYIGGSFTSINGVTGINRIAKWTPSGNSWSVLGSGIDGIVYAIAIDSNNNVYAGGSFSNAGGISIGYGVAKWTPSDNTNGAWSALGSSVNGIVWSLIVDSDNNLYAGGSFSSAGGVSGTSRIAKWTPSGGTSGGVWSALGSGVNNTVRAINAKIPNKLYIGGLFTAAGNAVANDTPAWGIVQYS